MSICRKFEPQCLIDLLCFWLLEYANERSIERLSFNAAVCACKRLLDSNTGLRTRLNISNEIGSRLKKLTESEVSLE